MDCEDNVDASGQFDSSEFLKGIREIRDTTSSPGLARAAVLLPLLNLDGEWHILFQQRALDIEMQPGDVCFPGGHTEDGETQEETVLREVSEELCVSPSQIELLRKMPEMQGPGGLIVTPFVGVLHDYEGSFDPKEVDHVFTVPLSWFEANPPECHEARYELVLPEDFPYELIRGGKDYPFRKLPHSMYFYRHPEAVIWGFTAKLIKRFMGLLVEMDMHHVL